MEYIEIHLNRRGINSIEVPPDIEVETGSVIPLRLVNHGSPIHVTVTSANSSMYTRFYHENLYVQDFIDLPVAIREDAYPGFFDIEIITGYGTKKAAIRIFVAKAPEIEEPAEEPAPDLMREPEVESVRLLVFLIVIAVIAYIGWLGVGEAILNYVAFLALFGGIYVAWHYQH
jgi:membrane-associated protease RseP (regulator of RpoE activity)